MEGSYGFFICSITDISGRNVWFPLHNPISKNDLLSPAAVESVHSRFLANRDIVKATLSEI